MSQDAGWSSLVARQAHNLKAAGSNPAPATNHYLHGVIPAPESALIKEFEVAVRSWGLARSAREVPLIFDNNNPHYVSRAAWRLCLGLGQTLKTSSGQGELFAQG